MGIESLYALADLQLDEDHFKAMVSIDPQHSLFKGHFPGQPLLPGVILIRMMHDVAERITRQDVQLKNGSNIKFLNIIDPEKTSRLIIEGNAEYLDDDHLSVHANVSAQDIQFFKFKGVFTIFVSKDN